MNKKGFAANSVLEAAGFILAVFLILVVLTKFIFMPTTGYAAESEKSLELLNKTLTWASETEERHFQQPVSIAEGHSLVRFSKLEGDSGELRRSSECGSISGHSCLCMCEDENCQSPIRCVGFKQFDKIAFNQPSNPRSIEGGGIVNMDLTISSSGDEITLQLNGRVIE
jgi:hypothetical protein